MLRTGSNIFLKLRKSKYA